MTCGGNFIRVRKNSPARREAAAIANSTPKIQSALP
jgi:hypothetical protein